MNWRYIYHILLIFAIWLIQIGLISALPYPFNRFNLALVSLFFLLLFDDLALVSYWSLGLGTLLSFTSHLPFGILLISLWVTVLIGYVILYQILTNRSMWALLLLVLIGTVTSELIISLLSWTCNLFLNQSHLAYSGNDSFQMLGISILLNTIAMLAMFSIISAINPKLKPFLLIKKRK